MDYKSFGRKIKFLRLEKSFSIKVCASKIGITPRYLIDIERGDKIPKLETFLLICNVLEASADNILQDSLVAGYNPKSNDLLHRLSNLDDLKKKQALELFESIVTTLEHN